MNMTNLYLFTDEIKAAYERLPVKIRLFIGMLLAANTAGLAIYFGISLFGERPDYLACVGSFLAVRVYLFMANKSMPLTDENVAFMSSERILWNLTTIAILGMMNCLISLISLLTK